MIPKKDCEAIALKRFSLISPILNGQVPNKKKYLEELCAKPIDMPYYGLKSYTPKTIDAWFYDYMRNGIDALKPSIRSDKGSSRKLNASIADAIALKVKEFPRITKAKLYELLIKDGVFTPLKVSMPTFYRYLSSHPYLLQSEEEEPEEFRRFSHQFINELWQTDVMYGPYLTIKGKKYKTYLIAYIDDASRLITHASFHFEQNFSALRSTLKDAILTRGVPKMLYTDNGKIYRCDQLSLICASVGFSILHAKIFTPTSKGKIERFFQTVRTRFLSCLDTATVFDLDDLNSRFSKWLIEDYQCKEHSSIKSSPLDFFMSQVDRIHLFSDPALLDEHFLLRVNRKVHHDATIKLDTFLFETDPSLANRNLEVRYDPERLTSSSEPILLFEDGKRVGEARRVQFHDNAHVKRNKKSYISLLANDDTPNIPPKESNPLDLLPNHSTVSFSSLLSSDNQ